MTYEEVVSYFEECRNYWENGGDSRGVATSKAFWWDCVGVWNLDKSWNEAKEKFAMDWRGYKKGNPIPEADYVERGAV